MALQTRAIATYLRDGSLWVGNFIVSDGELDFGDERFDASHGLARYVHAEPTNRTREADPQWNGAPDQPGKGRTPSTPRLHAMPERLKLAA